MLIRQIRTGGDRNLAYLVADSSARIALVIDPSYAPDKPVRVAHQAAVSIRRAFCTHGHHDHTNGNPQFERLTGVRPLLFGDIDPLTRTSVSDSAKFPLGELAVQVIHTPGHTPDSICLLIGDALFTGDTLFVGKVGGTDLGRGAEQLYASLHDKLLALPPATRVFPGHDVGVASESTIAHERETNPFLRCPDLDSFIHLKRTWASYKKEHGIA